MRSVSSDVVPPPGQWAITGVIITLISISRPTWSPHSTHCTATRRTTAGWQPAKMWSVVSTSQLVSQNVIRKGRGSLGLNFRANIENLPPAAGGRGRGGSKQELVKSLIVLQSVSTVLTEARSGRAMLRRIQNEDRSGKCFMTKQQQHRDSLRETNAAKYPQVFTVGLSPANSIIWKR